MTSGVLCALLAVASGAGAAPDAARVREAVRAYRLGHELAVLQELVELLKIPNLASDEPNIRRNAAAVVQLLERRGFRTEQLEVPGSPPAVYGELPASGPGPTVIFYAHYDGQPVDPAQWAGSPWQPLLRDKPLEDGGREVPATGPLQPEWRLYARGASDDKAPIVGLLAALDALRAAGLQPSVRLKVFFEGEEEAGSPHLAEILKRHADRLKSDLWLLCDGPVHQSRRMQLYFGARGITDVELTVYGPTRALHSGHYGNWAPNPALLLAHLVSGLRDPDGRITIAGFGDDVRPPTEAERQAVAGAPDVDEELRQSLGLAASEAGNARLVERILIPALNVRGLEAGHVGEKAANAIPVEARASIDFRLVPDQTPERVRALFEAHLRGQGFFIVSETPGLDVRRAHPRVVKLTWGAGYPPARTRLDLPLARAVTRVVAEAFGAPPVTLPTLGGSIPMHLFADLLKTPVVGVPIANHDNNQHAANENLRLQNLWDGLELYAALLARLGSAAPAAGR
jgi:acetylornithine deacetylase/succinyl-diaminopimelate desuccinylase-like protein